MIEVRASQVDDNGNGKCMSLKRESAEISVPLPLYGCRDAGKYSAYCHKCGALSGLFRNQHSIVYHFTVFFRYAAALHIAAAYIFYF